MRPVTADPVIRQPPHVHLVDEREVVELSAARDSARSQPRAAGALSTAVDVAIAGGPGPRRRRAASAFGSRPLPVYEDEVAPRMACNPSRAPAARHWLDANPSARSHRLISVRPDAWSSSRWRPCAPFGQLEPTALPPGASMQGTRSRVTPLPAPTPEAAHCCVSCRDSRRGAAAGSVGAAR